MKFAADSTMMTLFCVLQIALISAVLWRLPAADYANAGPAAAVEKSSTASLLAALAGAQAETIEALRGVVRQELRLALAASEGRETPAPGVSGGSAPATDDRPTTVEQRLRRQNAAIEAEGIIAGAIDAGRWTEQDTRRLQGVYAHLSNDDRHRLTDRLFTAINRQQLEIDRLPDL